MKRIPIFAANWKMNKRRADVAPYAEQLLVELEGIPGFSKATAQVLVFPPAIYLELLKQDIAGSGLVDVGSQHTGLKDFGAYTGDVSAAQVKDLGLHWTLVGHSERRQVFHESDDEVAARLKCALDQGLRVLFCIGETSAERKGGKTWDVLGRQLAVLTTCKEISHENLVVAYEPVWAIGTGETATAAQAQEAHKWIRDWLTRSLNENSASFRLLYGGSVKAENSAELMVQPDVDGLLVGGASLDARAFAEIIKNGIGSAVSKR